MAHNSQVSENALGPFSCEKHDIGDGFAFNVRLANRNTSFHFPQNSRGKYLKFGFPPKTGGKYQKTFNEVKGRHEKHSWDHIRGNKKEMSCGLLAKLSGGLKAYL